MYLKIYISMQLWLLITIEILDRLRSNENISSRPRDDVKLRDASNRFGFAKQNVRLESLIRLWREIADKLSYIHASSPQLH